MSLHMYGFRRMHMTGKLVSKVRGKLMSRSYWTKMWKIRARKFNNNDDCAFFTVQENSENLWLCKGKWQSTE